MIRVPSPKWESEAAMLQVVIDAARARGWRALPETAGHDLVLVVGDDCGPDSLCPGDVVVVEGKLRDNVQVLAQALPADSRGAKLSRSADWYAVAVPSASGEFRDLAYALGIVVLPVYAGFQRGRPDEHVLFPLVVASSRFRCIGLQPLELHDLDVEMRAGEPAPRPLSPWKIAAVRLCILGQTRPLTAEDFRPTPVRHRTFLDRGWMTARREGQSWFFDLADHPGRPDIAYPEITDAIRRRDPIFEVPAMSRLRKE